MIKILAIASFGGHWQQLQRITSTLSKTKFQFTFATTVDIKDDIIFHKVKDFNAKSKVMLIISTLQFLRIILKERPNIIITTGAAPGVAALLAGKLLWVKKRIWIDSIANAEKLSKSGKYAGFFATERISQWQHVAEKSNNKMPVKFIGRII